MRKISWLGLILASFVQIRAAAQMIEFVCYYHVTGEGNLLSAQDLIDLRYKRQTAVVAWTPGRRLPTLFGYGPDKFSEYTYTIQEIGVVPRGQQQTEFEALIKEMKKNFADYGVINPQVSFLGCKTSRLQQ